MHLRPSPLVLLALSLPACGGVSSGADLASGGAASGGAGSFAGSREGTLLEPSPVTSSPEVVGPSPVECEGVVSVEPAVVRACVLAGSCSPFAPPTSLSDCITMNLPESGGLPSCVIGAQSCAEMDACIGKGFYRDACPVDAPGQICVGSKVVDCEKIPRNFSDCAQRGGACAPYSSQGDGVLDAAACVVDVACATDTAGFACSGTKRFVCQQGLAFGEDCAARGLSCVVTATGAACVLSPACTASGVGSCDSAGDGNYCDGTGRALKLSCSRLGFACQPSGHGYGVECGDPGCAPEDAALCFEECDGPMAHLCLGGRRHSIDCTSYGFRACVLETRPEEGDRARCGF